MNTFGYGFSRMILIFGALVLALWGWHCGGPTGGDDNPELAVSADSLDFGEARNSLPLTISNAGTGVLDWRIQVPSEGWVSVSQVSGSIVNTPMSIDVRIDREKAPPGEHRVTLMVTSGEGGQRPVTVRAVIANRSPVLQVAPVSLDFGESGSSLVLTVSNAGKGTLHWAIAAPSEGWIALSQREGNTAGEAARVDVRIDREKAPAGRQQVTLVITGDGGARQEVALAATITRPVLAVTPAELLFDAGAQSKSLIIENGGTGTLAWSAEAPEGWLQVEPQSGRTQSQASTVTVSVDRSRVAENGTYSGEVTVTSDGGTAIVPVAMVVEGKVSPAELRVSPVSLAFGETSMRKTIGISNAGRGEMGWQASAAQGWISLSPDSGRVAGGEAAVQVIVEVDRAQMAPGEHRGSVDVVSDGGSASVPVTVSVPAPVIALSARDLDFRGDLEVLPLEIANTGTGELAWEFSEEPDWLEVKPAKGTTGQVATSVRVNVRRQGLAAGRYEGKVRLTSNSTAEPSIEVRVAMEVGEQPVLSVTPEGLDFGEGLDELALEVGNANNGTLVWQMGDGAEWISFDRVSGELGLLEKESVAVAVNRQGLASGVYQAQVEFTSNGGNLKVPVRMVVLQAPVLVVDGQGLDLGTSGVTGMLTLRNGGTGRLSWRVEEELDWCAVVPDQGTTLGEVDTLRFTANRAGLAPGSYTGTVTVVSDGGEQEIAVEMQVAEAPILGVSAESLEFGTEAEALALTISSQGNTALVWNLTVAEAWVQATPGSGELGLGEEMAVEVRVAREGLALGDYQGVLTLDSNGGKREIQVTARVEGAILTVSAEALDFGEKLERMTVILRNEGNIPLEWSAVEGLSWLTLSVEQGTVEPGGAQVVETVVDRAGLAPGEYAGVLTITSNDARGPMTLRAAMAVLENHAPIADAGPDQRVVEGKTVQLDGSGSQDDDGDALSFLWEAPAGIALRGATSTQASFAADTPGEFRIRLTVSDGQTDSESDEVVVTVIANTADAEVTGEIVDEGDEEPEPETAEAEVTGEIEEEEEPEPETAEAEVTGEIEE